MRLKTLLLCLLAALLLAAPAAAQAPAWQLALASRGGTATVSALAAGPGGAVYLAGSFGGTVQFGGVTLTSQTDGRTGFVARWNPAAGAFAWGWALGPTTYAGITTLAVRDSLVYAAGPFVSQTLHVGSLILVNADTTKLGEGHSADICVVRLRDEGRQAVATGVWQAGSAGEDACQALAATTSSVYVVGTFDGPQLDVGSRQLEAAGEAKGNLFMARLDEQAVGQASWLRWLGTNGDASVAGNLPLAAVGSNCYLALDKVGAASLGALPDAVAGADVFLVKLTDAGPQPQLAWAQPLTGTREEGVGIAALALTGSSVYVAGSYRGDTLRLGQQVLPGRRGQSTFVAKLLDTGPDIQLEWWQQLEGGDCGMPLKLVASDKQVYLMGNVCDAAMQAGPIRIQPPWHPWAYASELFVLALRDAGPDSRFEWAATAGIRGLRRMQRTQAANCFRDGTHIQWLPRLVAANAVVLAGPQLYLAGDTEGVTRFGRHRLRYPVHGRRAAWLAALPAAP